MAVVPHGYQRPEGGVKVIGAAYTPKPEADAALAAAISLARSGGTELRVLTALDPKHAHEEADAMVPEHLRSVDTDAKLAARVGYDLEAQARARVTELAKDLPATVDVITDEPARALVAASKHLDLLVMGSRGLGTRKAVILGSVSRRVIDQSECPVIVIPRDTTAKRDELLADVEAHAPQAPEACGVSAVRPEAARSRSAAPVGDPEAAEQTRREPLLADQRRRPARARQRGQRARVDGGRQHDHPGAVGGPQAVRELQPVHAGHAHVDDDHVGVQSAASRRAVAPSRAWPTSSNPGVQATIARAAAPKSGWSSTVISRTGRGIVRPGSPRAAAALHGCAPSASTARRTAPPGP